MKRLPVVIATFLIVLLLAVPGVLAANHGGSSDRALISLQGDVTLGADQEVDLLLVVGGTATVAGDATNVVAIDGRAVLAAGTTGHVLAIGSPVAVGPGATITGDVTTLDAATVTVSPGATLGGSVQDLAPRLIGVGAVLAPALFLLFLGVLLINVVAGLALAAVAARQVRAAERLISREPGPVLVAGLAGIFLPVLLVIGLFITVIGAPLAVAILITVWPLTAYVGYLVAGIWIGDWVLGRLTTSQPRERPYAAAVVGLIVLQALAVLPPVTAIASLFGFGAVLLLAWRTFRGGSVTAAPAVPGAAVAPMPG